MLVLQQISGRRAQTDCNATDFPQRVYICDECVMVCASILEDDSGKFSIDPVGIESQEQHPALRNPLTSQFLRNVERWISLETSGADSTAQFVEVQSLAMRLFGPKI